MTDWGTFLAFLFAVFKSTDPAAAVPFLTSIKNHSICLVCQNAKAKNQVSPALTALRNFLPPLIFEHRDTSAHWQLMVPRKKNLHSTSLPIHRFSIQLLRKACTLFPGVYCTYARLRLHKASTTLLVHSTRHGRRFSPTLAGCGSLSVVPGNIIRLRMSLGHVIMIMKLGKKWD